MATDAVIGVIGGSGLYDIPGIEGVEEIRLDTPFGAPSDAFICGRLGGVRVVFVPRHGRGHRVSPTEVNYRANIWGLKKLGAEWIISVSAVGSLREEVVPGHVVLIDQFIDRTKGVRPATFFEDGVVGHVGFADPICETLRQHLKTSAEEAGATFHDGGTYVCMEGPQFSTRAESHLYRSWGARVIGMTNLTEAKLAREAEMSYATLAMATDYDCWHEEEEDVSVEGVIAVLNKNVDTAKRIIALAVPRIAAHEGPPPQAGCMEHAVMTAHDQVSDEAFARVELFVGEYLRPGSAS